MKKTASGFMLGFLFCITAFLCLSCASAPKKDIIDPDDQVAGQPVVAAHKIETGRYSDGVAMGYKYVSPSDGTVFATESIDEKGSRSIEGKIPDGLIIQYYDDKGSIASELNYNAGKLEGIIKEFYPDGTTAAVKNYKAGELNGPVKEYYPNGSIKEEASYVNGELSGILRKYSDTGTVIFREEYHEGELNGVYKEYYVNGKIKVEAEYMNGKKEGFQKEYDPSGILLAEYNYSMGKLEGQSRKYYEDGTIQMIANYSGDKQDGETKIFSNNNSDSPIYIDIYKSGKRVKRKAYSAKGQLIFTLNY